MRKPLPKTIENLRALERMGGGCPSSEWVVGSKRYTTRRALPPFAMVVQRVKTDDGSLHWRITYPSPWSDIRGQVRRNLEALLKARPRVEKVVVIADLRAARFMLKMYEVTI